MHNFSLSLKEKRRGVAGCGVENGEISLWDTVDGQCLESKRMAQVHTIMQAYRYHTPHTPSVELLAFQPDLVYSRLV